MDIPLIVCRGERYDEASSNMVDAKTSVVTCIEEIEPRAILTHCYSHTLQLSVHESNNINESHS